jgi:serine/threonine-protein kinase
MAFPSRPPAPESARDPLIGAVLADKYHLDKLIGVGGMGAVYRATQLAVSRPVAVKVLRPVAGVSEHQLVERFRREAVATSRLRHPNTVQVIDFGETQGVLFMVLELLEGVPLARLIGREAPLAPERVAAIGKQIAKSLAEAHQLGIVHRDLKPDNVFICNYHGDPDFTKVMDFGIARLVTASDSMTRTGMMIGTPRYMPPEQAMAKKVGPAADLYALGVILYEMLTGVTPFSADSNMALAIAHINEPPPPLVLPGYPEPLAEAWRGLVTALLTKNPEKRPQDASQVATWLGQLETDAQRWAEARFPPPQKGASRSETSPSWPTPPKTPSPGASGLATPQGGRSPLVSSLPGREPTATYDGPQPRSTVNLAQAVGPRGTNPAWIWSAAAVLMVLGGLVAFLLIKPSRPKVERAPAGLERLDPDAGAETTP